MDIPIELIVRQQEAHRKGAGVLCCGRSTGFRAQRRSHAIPALYHRTTCATIGSQGTQEPPLYLLSCSCPPCARRYSYLLSLIAAPAAPSCTTSLLGCGRCPPKGQHRRSAVVAGGWCPDGHDARCAEGEEMEGWQPHHAELMPVGRHALGRALQLLAARQTPDPCEP